VEGEEGGEAGNRGGVGVPLRLMMMGRMSTVVPGQCCRIGYGAGVIVSNHLNGV
jgi:hypothetical protein